MLRLPFRTALVIIAFLTSQAHASRSVCEQAISKSGFTPEKPYQFEDAGFFRPEKHIFGVFTCEINSDGTVRRVLRGQSVISEDGFYGIEALALRSVIESASSERFSEARSERDGLIAIEREKRDKAIEKIRASHDRTYAAIEAAASRALNAIQRGEVRPDLLDSLGIPEAAYSSFAIVSGQPPIEKEAPPEADAEPKKQDDSEQAQNLPTRENQSFEEMHEDALKLIAELDFETASKVAKEALVGGGWTEDQVAKIEEAALQAVRPLPSSQRDENRRGYELLAIIRPENNSYLQKTSDYSSFPLSDYWVVDLAAKQPSLHSCPSERCGIAGTVYHGNKLEVKEFRSGFARVTDFYPVLCERGHMSADIDTGNTECSIHNGYIGGKIARWVDASFLSQDRPSTEISLSRDNLFLSGSDDLHLYKDQFVRAANDLISQGKCTKAEIQEMGGWGASPSRGRGHYFVWCNSLRDRYYLDATTGRISR